MAYNSEKFESGRRSYDSRRSGSRREDGRFDRDSFGEERREHPFVSDPWEDPEERGRRSRPFREEGRRDFSRDDRRGSRFSDRGEYSRGFERERASRDFGGRYSEDRRRFGDDERRYGDGDRRRFRDDERRYGDGDRRRFRDDERRYGEGDRRRFGDDERRYGDGDRRRFSDYPDRRFSERSGRDWRGSYEDRGRSDRGRFERNRFGEDRFGRSRFDGNAGRYSERPPRRMPNENNLERHQENEQKKSEGFIRLNRYIANAGVCSRREADELIQSGAILVNGEPCTQLGSMVGPNDQVQYKGQMLNPEKKVYILLNKPKGYITTADDPEERRTVMDLLEGACKERIYPVGRLDRNTTGVLLFTNDGDLAKRLTHPSHGARKIYHITLSTPLTKADFQAIAEGVMLDDGFVEVDDIDYVETSDRKELGIQLHSGKNRIVRRIFEHFGYEVVKLDRVLFAELTKKDLPRGHWRFLSDKEVEFLQMNSRLTERKEPGAYPVSAITPAEKAAAEAIAEEDAKPKAARGRKKKTEADAAEAGAETAEAKPKATRGRKKKTEADAAEAGAETAEAKPKATRGRKKKTEADAAEAEAETAEAKPKATRGRKKKAE